MWQEFVQAKDIWIGGTLESASGIINTELTDITLVGTILSFVGKEFTLAARESNVSVVTSTLELNTNDVQSVELKVLGGDIIRWRITRPQVIQAQDSAQHVASHTSVVP